MIFEKCGIKSKFSNIWIKFIQIFETSLHESKLSKTLDLSHH